MIDKYSNKKDSHGSLNKSDEKNIYNCKDTSPIIYNIEKGECMSDNNLNKKDNHIDEKAVNKDITKEEIEDTINYLNGYSSKASTTTLIFSNFEKFQKKDKMNIA